jgi:NADH-quinone oxidoreductase subunit K
MVVVGEPAAGEINLFFYFIINRMFSYFDLFFYGIWPSGKAPIFDVVIVGSSPSIPKVELFTMWEPILFNTINNEIYYLNDSLDVMNIFCSILLGQLLIFVGLFGVMRRFSSILLALLSLELAVLGLNFSIIVLGLLLNHPFCVIISMVLFILSAVETAIGLALVLLYYKAFNTTALRYISRLRY